MKILYLKYFQLPRSGKKTIAIACIVYMLTKNKRS